MQMKNLQGFHLSSDNIWASILGVLMKFFTCIHGKKIMYANMEREIIDITK